MAALRARHRISRWGATDEEATCSLAGDETVPDPGIVSTRAIDIHAPAHVVDSPRGNSAAPASPTAPYWRNFLLDRSLILLPFLIEQVASGHLLKGQAWN